MNMTAEDRGIWKNLRTMTYGDYEREHELTKFDSDTIRIAKDELGSVRRMVSGCVETAMNVPGLSLEKFSVH